MEVLKQRLNLLLEQQKAHILSRGRNYYVAVVFNILVLYVTLRVMSAYWPIFIRERQQSIWHVYFFGYQGVIWLVHGLNYLFYGIVDKYTLLPQYKITKTNLLWDVDPAKWQALRNRSIKLNIINVGIISPIVLYLESVRTKVYVCMLVESIFFYLFHRISHEYLYQFHKVHHQFVVPTPLATNHNHPIDYITGTLIPFTLGVKLFGAHMHFLTFVIWGIWRICEGYEGHSNYEFPWSPLRVIPFSASSEYHSYHHTHNVGNFSSTMLFQDTLTNTNTEYFKHKKTL